LRQDIAALTVHLRTVKELSQVPAHWEYMPEVVKLRNNLAPETVLLGNGDLSSLAEIKEKYDEYGCEGFMIGRGIFANPWVFNPQINMAEVSVSQRVDLYLRHIDLFYQQWGGNKNFALLKKFAKTYISNFPDVSRLREKLMEARTIQELIDVLHTYRKNGYVLSE